MAALGRGNYVNKFENRYRRKDGGWCLLSWTAAPDERYVHAIGRDITADREQLETIRRTELALQQSQKMETIGKLTGGVAHDFNNLLQIISGNLQLLQMAEQARAAAHADCARWIENARSAVDKGAKLASYLLAFGRRQPLEPKVIRISRLVANMEDLLRRSLGEEIEIEMVISGGLWNTAVDVAQVENALLNLAINARDAMSGSMLGRRRMTIEATNAILDDLYCRAHADVIPGQYVMLAVTDTGCGMPPEVASRALVAFYSTKEEGKGTGLGLSMVHGLAEQSGGRLVLHSRPGHGSRVELWLPRAAAVRAAQPVTVAFDPALRPAQPLVVLAVDDDSLVLMNTAAMLEDLGHTVLAAPSALDALDLLGKNAVDVVVTDHAMPQMTGLQLAREIRALQPDLPILLATGYAELPSEPGVDVPRLAKPYSQAELARLLRRVFPAG
jgi:signal transduction histidine kinase